MTDLAREHAAKTGAGTEPDRQALRRPMPKETKVSVAVLSSAVVLFVVHVVALRGNFTGLLNSVMVSALIISVVSFGQGTVVLSGGFDLSIPWTMVAGGVLVSHVSKGADGSSFRAILVALLAGAVIGAANGGAVAVLRIPPIVATLAMNVILTGLILIGTGGSPTGGAPPIISRVVGGTVPGIGIPSAALLLVLLWLVGSAVLLKSSLGRRIYFLGDNPRAALLSGFRTGWVTCSVYVISSTSAALGGVLLAGYSGRGALGMGDAYLLPSLAAVVLGGAAVMGGRGVYSGTVAGALLLAEMDALLASLNLGASVRSVIFGVAIIGSTALLQVQGRFSSAWRRRAG